MLLEVHKKLKTNVYHYLTTLIYNETGLVFSDNFAHKFCKFADIRSKTNRVRKHAGKEGIIFPNAIKGNWNVKRPLEIVVPDMTCIYHKGVRWEWTYTLNTFNNEIIASSVTNKVEKNLAYYECLNTLIEKTKERNTPAKAVSTLQTAFSKTIKIILVLSDICQELSLDKPIIEPLNGWIK